MWPQKTLIHIPVSKTYGDLYSFLFSLATAFREGFDDVTYSPNCATSCVVRWEHSYHGTRPWGEGWEDLSQRDSAGWEGQKGIFCFAEVLVQGSRTNACRDIPRMGWRLKKGTLFSFAEISVQVRRHDDGTDDENRCL